MTLNHLQRMQLAAYVATCITLDRFLRTTEQPPPGAARDAYWLERNDLEDDKRNKFSHFESSLTWAHDCCAESDSNLLAVLKRLDTSTTYNDSHSPYFTFNEDDATAIRAAVASAQETA